MVEPAVPMSLTDSFTKAVSRRMILPLDWPRTLLVANRRSHWRRITIAIAILGGSAVATSLLASTRALYAIAVLMAVWCSVAAITRARSDAYSRRIGWRWVSAGSFSAALAMMWWFVSPPSTNDVARELPGHFAMLATTATLLLAAIYLRPPRRRVAKPLALTLDLVVATATIVSALWVLLIGPVVQTSNQFGTKGVLTLVHAVSGGLFLLCLVVIALRVPIAGGYRSTAAIVAGLAGIALADIGWTIAWVSASPHATEASAALAAGSFTAMAIVIGRERRRGDEGAANLPVELPASAESAGRDWLVHPPMILLAVIIGNSLFGTRQQSDLIVIVGSLLVIALVLVRQTIAIREAKELTAYFSRQAERDPLTNLINHRKLHERLERELEHARSTGQCLAVALIDIDHFKQINDRFGHVVGDHVLKSIADTLARASRETDFAARYAGDEFALVLPGLGPADTAIVGERLLRAVIGLALWPGADAARPVSISIGFAVTRGQVMSGTQMIAAADAALYRAKGQGRNRFVVIDADLPGGSLVEDFVPRRLIVAHPNG